MNLEMGIRALVAAAAFVAPLAATACDDASTGSENEDPALLSVTPQGGATGINPESPIVIVFSHPMMQGMEEYADVHEGEVEGPLVPGSWNWNEDYTKLTFTPDSPLKSQTRYVIHIGGGMQDQNGQHIDYQQHGSGMGGQWMTQQMHLGGQHGYGMGGMGGGTGMGQGWVHPGNGGYGMIFIFTTA